MQLTERNQRHYVYTSEASEVVRMRADTRSSTHGILLTAVNSRQIDSLLVFVGSIY